MLMMFLLRNWRSMVGLFMVMIIKQIQCYNWGDDIGKCGDDIFDHTADNGDVDVLHHVPTILLMVSDSDNRDDVYIYN